MTNEQKGDLIRRRLEQAQVALDDAKFLFDGKRSPQGVVNRAYYAMFYAVLALLQKIGKIPSKHTGAIGLFDTEFVLKGVFPKDLSKDFHRAFELRQNSDYRITEPLSPEKAEEMWKKAAHFVESVRKYLLSPEAKQEE
jgi:uncharacterized protein (UPF0332 family)